ncbi:MAG: hypothetical protein PHC52_06710, partial [Syntrophales bacterium]|nr:hypothetical protein [Syntrophales bacterium]
SDGAGGVRRRGVLLPPGLIGAAAVFASCVLLAGCAYRYSCEPGPVSFLDWTGRKWIYDPLYYQPPPKTFSEKEARTMRHVSLFGFEAAGHGVESYF